MREIYGLTDKTGRIYYVGSTGVRAQTRLNSHISQARRKRTSGKSYSPVTAWVAGLLAAGEFPGVETIAIATEESAYEVERYWIQLLSKKTALLNVQYLK